MSVDHFPVEAGHIMMFARAIGDPNPVYYDRAAALDAGLGGILAPPTFVQAGAQFDPEYSLRPKPGQPWFGSGRTPSGGPRPNVGEGTRLHAEQRYEYHRPLHPGDVLHTTTATPKRWDKTNRRGQTLHFQEGVTTYLSAADEPVVTAHHVSVIVPPPSKDNEDTAPAAGASPAGKTSRKVDQSGGDREGGADRIEAVLVENLSRTQIVQYAGASGDYNPLHTDEVYATGSAGYRGVFAHGMLTMGMTGRLLTDTVGDGRLLSFGGRFTAQVWPGDTLTAVATRAEDPATNTVSLRVVTSNQDGVAVFVGDARASTG
jgi:acyl dehydratase